MTELDTSINDTILNKNMYHYIIPGYPSYDPKEQSVLTYFIMYYIVLFENLFVHNFHVTCSFKVTLLFIFMIICNIKYFFKL